MGKKAKKEIKNCLFRKRTPDKEAVRRHLHADDEDAFIMNFGHPYLVDAHQKIFLSKAMRRLSCKTQVLTDHVNAHTRTRASHTYEVMSIAATVARVLGLNENLCLAIAAGHDIGHAPLGHEGEKFISKVTGKKFRHEIFGVVLAQHLERRNRGLNLTHQVLEGMRWHSRGSGDFDPSSNISEESNVVMFADKLAYIWADVNDIFYRSDC